MGRSVTDNEREQTDESSQTEKSDAENLQPQQDKLTPSSKPMGEGGEQGGSDVNEENTKVGDIVYHNGKAVKIVEFRDSRKGGREAIIELPQLTKDEIHKQAIDILRNRYKEFDNTDEDVISNHRGDYLNQISDISHSDSNASKRVNVNFDELSKSQPTETKDTEDWSRDVESTAKALETKSKKSNFVLNIDKTKTYQDIDYGGITWQNSNLSSFNKGEDGKTYVTDKDGNIYEIKKTKLSANNTFLVQIKDNKGNKIGVFEFKKDKDDKFFSEESYTSKKGKGIASIAYDYASKDGELIKPSNKLTEDGIRFWSKSISEAYHKAKQDGSNPELVKAVVVDAPAYFAHAEALP